jgi:Sec-independent protein translocase protein TatA
LVVALVVIWVVFIYERVPSIGRFMAEIAETGRRWWQRRTVVEEED